MLTITTLVKIIHTDTVPVSDAASVSPLACGRITDQVFENEIWIYVEEVVIYAGKHGLWTGGSIIVCSNGVR